jgi:phenylacetate-CoA ligase
MSELSFDQRRDLESLERGALAQLQLGKLNRLLAILAESNNFYQQKFSGCRRTLDSLDQLADLPFTTKEELQPAAGSGPFANNCTFPVEAYVRCHETSGTHGRPLVVLDTAEDWRWWIDAWQFVLDAAQLTSSDRALLAFSFGPFIGFWSAFERSMRFWPAARSQFPAAG